jgi:hypothetical protein
MRVNHEYDRGGSPAYLAAHDIHRARVLGHCAPKTGIARVTTSLPLWRRGSLVVGEVEQAAMPGGFYG